MRYNVYDIQFTDESESQLNSYSDKLKRQITTKLEKLAHNPFMGKPLQGPLEGLHSYRVGKLRIIYRILKKEIVVIIVSISYRKEVYRKIG